MTLGMKMLTKICVNTALGDMCNQTVVSSSFGSPQQYFGDAHHVTAAVFSAAITTSATLQPQTDDMFSC